MISTPQETALVSKSNIYVYPDLKRYWDILNESEQELFFDREGLRSYTPQRIALEIAQQVTGNYIIDLFCGVGGNSIGFAKFGKLVKSIDLSKSRIKMAQANARKCKLETNIEFINTEALDFLSSLEKVDTVFLDPPWGGSRHRFLKRFYFKEFPIDVKNILFRCLNLAKHTIIKLPFNFNINELSQFKQLADIKIIRHYLPNYTTKRPIILTAHFKR